MANQYYQNTDSFTPGTPADGTAVDAKFNAVTSGFDAADLDVQRAIKMPAGSADQVITQNAAGRIDKAVGFDANGDLTLHPNAGTSATNAATSATAAATSEANAATSATDSANSAASSAASAAAVVGIIGSVSVLNSAGGAVSIFSIP